MIPEKVELEANLFDEGRTLEMRFRVPQLGIEHYVAARCDHGVAAAAQECTQAALNWVVSKLVELDKLQGNIREPSPDNRFFYNCTTMPLAYDFLAVLLQAEMRRARDGVPGPLKVGFFWGRNPDKILPSIDQARCYHNLTRPLLQLVGAVEHEGALTGGRNIGEGDDYLSYAPIVEAYNRGEPLPKLTVPQPYVEAIEEAVKRDLGQPPVIITLREAEHHPGRNSDLPEWLRFADWLTARGEKVMIVRDTAKAYDMIPGYTVCHQAAENVLFRAAFYQAAKCNLFVSNGPAMLALFMDCPWLMFSPLSAAYKNFDAKTWKIATGIDAGGQWPWAKPNQRIVWAPDKFEFMRDAWLEHIAPKREEAA